MRWQFWQQPNETRADYTAQIIGALERAALARDSADIGATAAARMAAGFYARAFAAAIVEPQNARTAILTPRVLATMAAALILRGEYCARIEVNQTGLQLFSASSWDVDGGIDPATWRYVVTHPTPSQGDVKRVALAAEVLHPTTRRRSGPVAWRLTAGRSGPNLRPSRRSRAPASRRIRRQRRTAIAYPRRAYRYRRRRLTAKPSFKADLAALKGRTSIVPAAPDFVDGQGVASPHAADSSNSASAWTRRSRLSRCEKTSARRFWRLCGLKADLFTERTDGTALREALRHAVNLGVEPLARMVEDECREKLGTDVRLRISAISGHKTFGVAASSRRHWPKLPSH